MLVDSLSEMFDEKKISILDIGTGSGCIIVSLLHNLKQSIGLGIDISKDAILNARKNGARYNLQNRLKFLNKSLVNVFDQKFDLIVSNPPYVMKKDIKNLSDDVKRYEPRIALDGGNEAWPYKKSYLQI